MTISFTINLWWPLIMIGAYYLVGLLISAPMVIVSLSYPRPEWGRTLLGWLVIAWITPIMFCWELLTKK